MDKATTQQMMKWGGPITSVMGGLSTIMGGRSKRSAAQFQAKQARQNAGQERASAQRGAYDKRRQGRFIASKALARAAASGASAADPTVEKIIADIGAEAEYRALTEMFMGEERARGLETRADVYDFEGDQAVTASYATAGASITRGLARYGDERKTKPPKLG